MNLLALQQDFRHWLTSESAEAASRFGERAVPGLAVYLNNYRAQLMSCLGEAYPVLRAWIGDEAFQAAAAIHIDRVPPSSWTLDAYAWDFPGTILIQYSADAELGELALLERALSDVFVGPDATPVSADSLLEFDWERAVIRFVPTLTLLWLRTNAPAIWQAVNGGTASQNTQVEYGDPTPVLVWRQDFTSAFRVVGRSEADAVACLSGGLTFGALCTSLVDRTGERHATACAGRWLAQWLSDGLIAGIEAG